MTLNSNFENREKLVPAQKPTRMFGLKFGMQGLTLSVSFIVNSFGSQSYNVYNSFKKKN